MKFILLLSMVSIAMSVSAQKEYKLAKSSGRLNLNIAGAIVEGYAGNEIIFSAPQSENEVVDERAKGLRAINGSGFTDNTGLGIDVTVKGDEINVNAVSKDTKAVMTIKIPQNIKVSFTNTSNIYQSEIILKNMKNEIGVSTSFNKIKLENNTGPMSIKTLYGSVDAAFSGDIKGPVSIVSVYGYVDVSVPSTTKANVELSTSYGKLYAADGLKISLEKNNNEKAEPGVTELSNSNTSNNDNSITTITINNNASGHNSEIIKGKINGGGADLILKSNYKNVYLREK